MTEMNRDPTPRLEVSVDEKALIDSIIDDMIRSIRRSVISVDKPTEINSLAREAAVVDKIIETGVDKLRQTLKIDFYEKMFDRLCERCDREKDDATCSMGLLWIRAADSFRLVLSITKKYRGQPHAPPFSDVEAKEQLKQRGLWKK